MDRQLIRDSDKVAVPVSLITDVRQIEKQGRTWGDRSCSRESDKVAMPVFLSIGVRQFRVRWYYYRSLH